MADWDARFIAMAGHIATWSKDRSSKVGVVIVGPSREVRATGYNGFPRGVREDVPERHERPAKYLWTEHAERNAIFNAARIGVATAGCAMYMAWFPCAACARAIVQAGIVRLVASRPDLDDPRWGEEFKVAVAVLEEGGVDVVYHESQAVAK